MNDYAWVSQIFTAYSKFPNFKGSYVGRERYADPEPGAFYRRYTEGERLDAKYFPDELSLDLHPEDENWPAQRYREIGWASDEEDVASAFITAFPEIARAGRNYVISARCADIFRQFDMGAIAFYPTKLFQSDHKTRIGDDWFCMTFANVKQAFIPRKTEHTRQLGDQRWGLYTSLPDFEMELSAIALHGADIWVDPYLPGNALFLSGPLGDALADSGLLDYLAPVCKAQVARNQVRMT